MKKKVLFIHGAGKGAYADDRKLANGLQHSLGADYEVHCPQMKGEEDPVYESWKRQIEKELKSIKTPVFVVGHSMGGSVLIKALTEISVKSAVAGIYLIAAPFWGGEGWTYDGYKPLVLPKEVKSKLPNAPIFLYHSRDDENVPFEHLALYSQKLPDATVRKFQGRGHQFGNDLSEVADDIVATAQP